MTFNFHLQFDRSTVHTKLEFFSIVKPLFPNNTLGVPTTKTHTHTNLYEEGPLQPVSLHAVVADHHAMHQQVLSKVRIWRQDNLLFFQIFNFKWLV